jgi:glycoprotein endo-alpha-1,2-mannosidase
MPTKRVIVRALTVLLALAFLAVPGVSGAGARASRVSIFYYPWYGTPQLDGSYEHWAQDGHLPPTDVASSYYPARGPYSSADPSVLRAQMRDIAHAGVGEVISSWWGWGSPEDLRLPGVMQAAHAYGLSVAVQIEPYEKWQRTPEVLSNDLAHLRDLGITRVYVFKPFDGPIDDPSWAQINQDATGMQILAQTRDVTRAASDLFDGVYTYDLLRYGPRSFASLCARARAAHLSCAPSVGPGYDAFRANGDPRRLPRQKGGTYDRFWAAAVAAHPDRVTITSFNEWHEGTQIEPARSPAPRQPSISPIVRPYSSYLGAYGLRGRRAQSAYLARTALWARVFNAPH